MRHPIPILVTGAILALATGCRPPPQERTPVGSGEQADEPEPRPSPPPIYDAQGVRLPQDALSLGTPVPVGLEERSSGTGWVRWEGPVDPDEVTTFYDTYLTLPPLKAPHQVGRSIRYLDARPRQPGNPGRPVEVHVIPEQGGTRCAVTIWDVTVLEQEQDEEEEPIDLRDWKPSYPGEKIPSELL